MINHGERRPLTLIDADEEIRDDDVFNIGRIEFAEELSAQSSYSRHEVRRGQGLSRDRRRLRNGML